MEQGGRVIAIGVSGRSSCRELLSAGAGRESHGAPSLRDRLQGRTRGPGI
jgi:hypothetical protein